MEADGSEHRRYVRCTCYEPCRVSVDGQDHEGAVVDMSMGGAAIELDVHLDAHIDVGTPVSLYIERIGRIPTTVVRSLVDGIAVEFRIDRDKGGHLVSALKQVLSDLPLEDI